MFDDLEIYRQIVLSKGIVSAAKTLKISPGTATIALQRTEDQLGLCLIERSTRSFQVTQEGLNLFQVLQNNYSEIKDTIQLLQNQNHQFKGTLKISCVSSYFHHRICKFLAKYSEGFPQVLLEVNATDQTTDLIREGYDLGIRIGKYPDSELMFRKLESLQVVTAASNEFLSRFGEPRSITELPEFKTIGFQVPRTEKVFPWFEGKIQGLKLNHGVLCNSIEGIVTMGLQSMGVMQVPAYLILDHLQSGALKVLFPEHSFEVQSFICYPKGRGRHKKVSEFVRAMQDLSQESSIPAK